METAAGTAASRDEEVRDNATGVAARTRAWGPGAAVAMGGKTDAVGSSDGGPAGRSGKLRTNRPHGHARIPRTLVQEKAETECAKAADRDINAQAGS